MVNSTSEDINLVDDELLPEGFYDWNYNARSNYHIYKALDMERQRRAKEEKAKILEERERAAEEETGEFGRFSF